MPRGPMPAWVPAIVGLVLVVAIGGPLVERRLQGGGARAATPPSTGVAETGRVMPPPADLPPIRFTEVKLGPSPVSRFAFDRAVPGHVVGCEAESHDGGRTWTTGAAGSGRVPCGDPMPVPVSAPVPGAVSAWTQASDGTAYAAIGEPGRRPHLRWAPGVHGPWRVIATPGDVRALAADGTRIYAAAEMLGRGHHDAWDWTRWPSNVAIRGIDGVGATVVAWGTATGTEYGGYVVSRDGGVRLQGVAHGPRPRWAALDPHRPSDLLVVGEDGSLTRLQMPPG
jgi:hypothetical protein